MSQVNYEALKEHLQNTKGNFALLTQQATSTTLRLMKAFPGRCKALFSPEHGFFGDVAPGVKTPDSRHPLFDLPIYSLYGETRRPTDEMLEGVDRMVIDLCDIGVRCYTYLATLRLTLQACADHGIPVTVLDRQIPLGGVIDGPVVRDEFLSFVAPAKIPFCHGMTPGECAMWMMEDEKLQLELDVIRLIDWSHRSRGPWPNFIPPSPAIRSWDSAVLYPMTVFSEAYPAVDVDRAGPLAFRVIGAPWMDSATLITDLAPGLDTCGIAVRPYRFRPQSGPYEGKPLEGILFSVDRPDAYYPVTAGVLIYTALSQHYGEMLEVGARPEWLDRLMGSREIRATLAGGSLDTLFKSWIDAQEEFLKTRVDIYGDV